METEKLREYFKHLEDNYSDLQRRGAKTIDINMIISDLMKHRM